MILIPVLILMLDLDVKFGTQAHLGISIDHMYM